MPKILSEKQINEMDADIEPSKTAEKKQDLSIINKALGEIGSSIKERDEEYRKQLSALNETIKNISNISGIDKKVSVLEGTLKGILDIYKLSKSIMEENKRDIMKISARVKVLESRPEPKEIKSLDVKRVDGIIDEVILKR